MSTQQSPTDPTRSNIVSRSPGLAYERMREARRSHFAQSLVRKLTLQGTLLATLAATLAVVLVGGSGGVGQAGANPATLAAAGGAVVAAGVTAHAAVGTYRLRREPLTEREALALLAVEDAAAYLGIACGGLLVAATVVAAVLGWNAGADPSTTVVTAGVAAGAAVAAAVALATGHYLRDRLP